MREIPKKNRIIGGSMALFSAACFAGAAGFYAKSSQTGLMAVYLAMGMLQMCVGVILLKNDRKS